MAKLTRALTRTGIFCVLRALAKGRKRQERTAFCKFCRTNVGSYPFHSGIAFIIKAKQKSSRGRTRTSDLRVMSPTSCQLLYPAAQEKFTVNRRICQGIEIFSDTIPAFHNQDKKIGV